MAECPEGPWNSSGKLGAGLREGHDAGESPFGERASAREALPQPWTARPLSGGWGRPAGPSALAAPGRAARGKLAPADALNPTLLLRAFLRRWPLALGVGLVVGIVVTAATLVLLPKAKYSAKALLRVASIPPSIILPTGEKRADFATYQRNQMALVKSRRVLEAALKDPRVAALPVIHEQNDPIAWLGRELRVDANGEIMEIALHGDSPDALATLANAITRAYLKEVVEVEDDERRARYEQLEEIKNRYQKKLEGKRAQRTEIAEGLGSKDGKTNRLTHENALARRSLAEAERYKLEVELRRAQAELKALERRQAPATGPGPSATMVDAKVAEDPVLQQLNAEITKTEQKWRQARRLSKNPRDPSIVTVEEHLKTLKTARDKQQKAVRTWVLEQLRAEAASVADNGIDALRRRITVLAELEQMAAHDVQSFSEDEKDIGRRRLALERLDDEIEHAEFVEKRVGDELEVLDIELKAPSRVQLLEEASTPLKEADTRQKTAAMSGLAALAAVVLGISWLEYRARRIGAVDEVRESLGLPIVGVLPALSVRDCRALPDPGSSAGRPGHDLFVESIDITRATLLYGQETGAPRLVMITSAVAGEGKTSLACHLATSLARGGLKTLLVDADLRRPAVHRLFDLPQAPGMAELLRGEIGFDEVPRPSVVAGLWLIPAGTSDDRAIQALNFESTAALFAQMKTCFDLVLFDTAPVLSVADSLLVGRHVDAVICSVLRDVSRSPLVETASERLRTLGIRVIGAVVTGVQVESYYGRYT